MPANRDLLISKNNDKLLAIVLRGCLNDVFTTCEKVSKFISVKRGEDRFFITITVEVIFGEGRNCEAGIENCFFRSV